jgi:hypothetical protein
MMMTEQSKHTGTCTVCTWAVCMYRSHRIPCLMPVSTSIFNSPCVALPFDRWKEVCPEMLSSIECHLLARSGWCGIYNKTDHFLGCSQSHLKYFLQTFQRLISINPVRFVLNTTVEVQLERTNKIQWPVHAGTFAAESVVCSSFVLPHESDISSRFRWPNKYGFQIPIRSHPMELNMPYEVSESDLQATGC